MRQEVLIAAGAVGALALCVPLFLYAPTGAVREWVTLQKEEPVPLLFVGDIMLDRSVARHARAAGAEALFAGVQNVFSEHRLVVGNLEGTITNNPSVSEASSTILRFTFDPGLAKTIADAGVGVVSLANNHALDFGEFGLEDTLYYLEKADIASFGHPLNESRLATKAEVDGNTFCFVGYHELFYRDPAAVVEKIKEIEPECSKTILFAHWGVEYEHEPSASQQELAHLFVDNGADLVIGAHPHVVQPVEVYNNTAIFYSLGNFIFDQGWRAEVRRGAMVSVAFGDKETTFNIIPVNTYLEATLADTEVSAAVLADLGLTSPTFVLAK